LTPSIGRGYLRHVGPREATAAAIGVALIAIGAFVVLDGTAAAIALLVSGLVLVLIGVFGWQDSPALASGGVAETDGPTQDAAPGPEEQTLTTQAHGVDAVSGVPRDERDEPRPVSEEVPAPHPLVGEAEAVADPLGRGRSDGVLDDGAAPADETDQGDPSPEPTVLVGSAGEGHSHDRPILTHGDLVTHVRDHHPDVPTDGSTIQLRLLHEREHPPPS
jgi:hypothetical protein